MTDGRNRVVLAALAASVLAVLGFWLLRGDAAVEANTPEEQQEPSAAAAPIAAAATQPSVLSERTEAPAPPLVIADTTLAHVRGRCVDENGEPLANCTAKLRGRGRNQSDLALQGKVDWQDPAPIVTGADGGFDFAFAPLSSMQLSFDVQAAGRVPRTGRWSGIESAQIIDLGDIVLGTGFEVRGRVVDELGVPVGGVGVRLNNLPLPVAPGMAANDTRYGNSAANGEFRVEVPIPAGTWPLDVDARGFRLLSPDHVTIGVRGVEPVLVTVRRMPSIDGTVVDEQGLPVAGVTINAELNRSGRIPGGTSGKDGTFTIFAVDAEPQPVQLTISDPGPCESSWRDARLWEWGSKDVRIVLMRALSFELTVVERPSGAPVTQYAVSCYSDKSGSSLQRDLRLGGDHPQGRVVVDRVWRGRNILRVIPIDKALQPSAKIEFEASDAGVAPMRVAVDRLRSATVRLTTADGEPVVGSKIEIVRKGTGAFDADAFVLDRNGSTGWSSDPKHRFHELLDTAVPTADGRAQVLVPPDPRDLVVRVTGQHPPAIVDPAMFVPGQDFVVVVPDGGGIVGRVKLPGLDVTRLSVQAQRPDSQTQRRQNRNESVLQADCSFAMRGLAPGGYQMRLRYNVPFRAETGGGAATVDLDVDVPDVSVVAGRDSIVEIDATALQPATLRGRLLLDGAVPTAARVFVRSEQHTRFGQFIPGADGVFEATELLPGTYRVVLVVGDFHASDGDHIVQDDTFTLAAGEQLVRDFVFLWRRLVVTVLQNDGKTPAAAVQLTANGPNYLENGTTNSNGVLVLEPAPAGKFTLHGAGSPLTVEIPAGKTEHAVTLVLPAAK